MTEWISVKDRLPNEGELVLTLAEEQYMRKYNLDYRVLLGGNSWIWATRSAEEMYRVTHWMPLPEPPKDEK